MKKNSLFLMVLIIGLFSYTSVSAMSYNIGLQGGYNVEISAIAYRNDGMVKAANVVNIDVRTLTGRGSISAYSADIQCNTYKFNGSVSCTDGCVIHAKALEEGGTIESKKVTIVCDAYRFNGTVSCFEECVINAKTFEGSGNIKGKKVTIICDEFKFQGTISCTEECTIYVKNQFDHTMFKRNGAGKYIVIVTKNNVELFSQESLLSTVVSELTNNCLNLTQEGIVNTLRKTRTRAVLNRIDDLNFLEELKKKVEAQAQYYRERLDEKRGTSATLHTGVAFGGVSSLGLCSAVSALLYNQSITTKLKLNSPGSVKIYAGVGGVVSLIPLFLSYMAISEWLNPRYKEKYEKLLLVITKIDQSLKTKRIPEEEIITLQ